VRIVSITILIFDKSKNISKMDLKLYLGPNEITSYRYTMISSDSNVSIEQLLL